VRQNLNHIFIYSIKKHFFTEFYFAKNTIRQEVFLKLFFQFFIVIFNTFVDAIVRENAVRQAVSFFMLYNTFAAYSVYNMQYIDIRQYILVFFRHFLSKICPFTSFYETKKHTKNIFAKISYAKI